MIRVISDTKVPIKIWASDLEAEAEQQLRNLSELPFIHSHISAMADAHAGKGSCVGTVIATRGAIIPSACGVDIGCGMCAMKLPFKVDELGGDENLRKLRHSIERSVPTGHNANHRVSDSLAATYLGLGEISQTAKDTLKDYNRFDHKNSLSLGSLGGGNHFIEICKDQEDNAWIMLHSGSRNAGKTLAEIHIDKAKNLMKEYFISVPHVDLAYLVQDTPQFKAYLNDLMWGQRFAMENRNEMMDRVLREVLWATGRLPEYNDHKANNFRVNCHHNYTNIEHHGGHNVFITRKGAVSAREGEYGIIPGSMGTRSYIVQGLGNTESFNSCSHGAGRRMSRTKAKALYTVEDLKAQTMGIECRKDKDVIDEIPSSYKDINVVMANQTDLVRPLYELQQLICIKGA